MPTNRGALVMAFATAALVWQGNAQQKAGQQKLPYAVDPANIPKAVDAVHKGDYGLVDVEMIAEANAVQAIPDLKREFVQSKDPVTRSKMANALVRMGLKDGEYWDYLVQRASDVLTSPAPTPFSFDQTGKALARPSAELTTFAHDRGISIEDAWQKALYDDPGAIDMLARTEDARAVPILREALKSRNQSVQSAAAMGLAGLKDTASIPNIITAARSAPREMAFAIAQALVYFDDVDAQQAVDTYVPQDAAQALREGRTKGATPFRR